MKKRNFRNAPKHGFNRKTEKFIKIKVLELSKDISHFGRWKILVAGLSKTLVPLAK